MTIRLDRVFIFGDRLSFLIPHEWVESNESGNAYLYHSPDADSGWLRASLISVNGSKCRSVEDLRSLLKERAQNESREMFEVGENIVLVWEQDSIEDGVPIINFCGQWHTFILP
jgi:hypothetical protein